MRMKGIRLIPIVVVLASPTTLAELSTDDLELLEQSLLAETRSGADTCAYTQTIRRSVEDEDGVFVTVSARFDPNRDSKTPWTIVSVDGRTPTDDEREEHEVTDARHPAVLNFGSIPIDEMAFVSEKDGIRTYESEWRGTRRELRSMGNNLTGYFDIHVATTSLKSVRFVAKEPFRHRVVAKIERFDQEFAYGHDANVGAVVLQSMNLDVAYSSLGRQNGRSVRARFTDFECD